MTTQNSFGTLTTLPVGGETVEYFSLPALERAGFPGVARLPYSLKILLENPLRPVELVIDHSVQVDHFGSANALQLNTELEYHRNRERYVFLRWGQTAFRNFRVVPPETGIVHQVNIEYLARVVVRDTQGGRVVAYPDTVFGTDSHTTMVNGLGVVGWGVGGIEAEAAMLGQPS